MKLTFQLQRYRHETYEILVLRDNHYFLTVVCDNKANITELEIWNDLFEEFETVRLSQKKSAWYIDKLSSIRDDLLLVIYEYNESKTAI